MYPLSCRSLGPLGPCGPPWALVGRALVGPPWALLGRALVPPLGSYGPQSWENTNGFKLRTKSGLRAFMMRYIHQQESGAQRQPALAASQRH